MRNKNFLYASIILIVSLMSLMILMNVNAQVNDTNSTSNDTNINITDNNTNINNTILNNTDTGNNETNQSQNNSDLLGNGTDSNVTINNTNLSGMLENLTKMLSDLSNLSGSNFTYPLMNNSICYFSNVYDDYNMTVNGTNITKQIALNVTVCYNQTLVYCFNDDNSSVYLYRINGSDEQCNNHGCDAQKVSNPYDATNDVVSGNDTILFVCWSKKQQDGWSVWSSKGMTLFNQNINVFDFSNSSFIVNDYNVTNTTVYNITNNITNEVVNNITNNFTYYYNITNNLTDNVTLNLTDIETRLTTLEEWRLQVTETLDYMVQIIDTLQKIIYEKIYVFNFSNSNFVANEYNVTNETVNNITNNITNNVTNNITNDISHIYNITNNITSNISAEQLAQVEDIKARLNILEEWRAIVDNMLVVLNQKITNLWDYIHKLI